MIQRFAERVARLCSWPRVGGLLVVYVVLISLMTSADHRIQAITGGLGVPDLMRFFSGDELYARIAIFGEEGRRIYLQAEILDLIYPLVYTATFISVIALAVRRRFGDRSRALLLCLLPIPAMACDYLENAGFFAVLGAFPARSPAGERIASAANAAKWSMVGVLLPLLVVSLLDTAVQGIRRRLSPPSP